MAEITKGISFLNPVDIDGDYLKKCAEYGVIYYYRPDRAKKAL